MSITQDLEAAAAQLTADTARVHSLVNPVLRTGDFAATVNSRNNVNTSGGPIIATLPPSKAAMDEWYFYDYGQSWDADNFTIDGNGHQFTTALGLFDRLVCDTSARFVVVFNGTYLMIG
jgi:hypothetical protein